MNLGYINLALIIFIFFMIWYDGRVNKNNLDKVDERASEKVNLLKKDLIYALGHCTNCAHRDDIISWLEKEKY